MRRLDVLLEGGAFFESPRWHGGRWWVSDFYRHLVLTVDADGREAEVLTVEGQPSGLGWLPDGDLLVVSMRDHRLLRRSADGDVRVHADLSRFCGGHLNDMVVSAEGRAYVGNFGFDLMAFADPVPATLVRVDPDGTATAAADDMLFPNGSVITPDGTTLIVGESVGGTYQAFDIRPDATLGPARPWAHVEGTAPDGCTLDADGGIWFSDAAGSQLVRVVEGGQVTHRVPTPMPTYACALGGDDGRTLFALCATGTHEADVAGKAQGAIYTMRVEVPHAGQP